MANDTEQVLDVIANIYDAALDAGKWLSVLEQSANFVGGCASALFLKDIAQHSQVNVFTWGYDPEFIQAYNAKYIHLDPFSIGQFLCDVEEIVCLEDLMPRAKFVRTRFFKEWVEPQNWTDAIGATLEKSRAAYGAFSVIRHARDGVADEGSRQRMRMLVPHLRRSLSISRMMELNAGHAAALADTLDGLAAAVFLVDEAGNIVHANAQGLSMTSRAPVVRTAAGKLSLGGSAGERGLPETLKRITNEGFALGGKAYVLPFDAEDGAKYIAHILPLTTGARRSAGLTHSALAAVFIREARLELPHPVEAIAAAYKLTRAEVAVLMGIVNVGRASDVAGALGISEGTVRAHLKKIFYKTEVTRQVDLARLVASFSGP